jgi:hypothetical protein
MCNSRIERMAGRRKITSEPLVETPRLIAPRDQVERELNDQIEIGRGLLSLRIGSEKELDDINHRARPTEKREVLAHNA